MCKLVMAFSEGAGDWFYLVEEYRPNFGKQIWFIGNKDKANMDESHLPKLQQLYPDMKFRLVY